MTGIDISKAAIKKAKALQPQINWICEDVITYDYPQDKFDLIFMSGPSFYNDENIDANLPIMDKIKQLVKPNGYFVFVKTTSLTNKWSKNYSRIDYNLNSLIDHFNKVKGLKKLSSSTIYPQLFLLFGKYAFSNKLLSFFSNIISKLTGIGLRVYLVYQKL